MILRNSDQNSTLRKISIFFFCIIILPAGFLYLSHLQSLKYFYKPLAIKYKQSDVRERCEGEGHQILLLCFKTDFYAALRSSDSYSAIHIHYLKNYLYELDRVRAKKNEQIFQLELEYLDMTYQFLNLTKEVSYDRKKIQVGSILLTRFFKKNVLSKLKEVPEKIESLEKLKSHTSGIDETEIARFDRLKFIYQSSVLPNINWKNTEL